jgi:hypothetical protein
LPAGGSRHSQMIGFGGDRVLELWPAELCAAIPEWLPRVSRMPGPFESSWVKAFETSLRI